MRKNRITRSIAKPAFRLLAMGAALAVLMASQLGAQPNSDASRADLETDVHARGVAIDKILGTSSVHDYISLLNGAQCAQVREANRKMDPEEAREALWRIVDSPTGVSRAVARGMDSDIRQRGLLLRIDDYRRKYDNVRRRLAETSEAAGGLIGLAQASGGGKGQCAQWAENLKECLEELGECLKDNEHYPQGCEGIRARCLFWQELLRDFCNDDDGYMPYSVHHGIE